MMRWLAVLLLLFNLGFAAWHQGLLGQWGFAPRSEREPERMTQQIRPEALRLSPASEPASAAAPTPPPPAQ